MKNEEQYLTLFYLLQNSDFRAAWFNFAIP